MKITPELLAALGFVRDRFGSWNCGGLEFDFTVSEHEFVGGLHFYRIGNTLILHSAQLLNAIFDAGVAEGRKRSATDFRRLIGLTGED